MVGRDAVWNPRVADLPLRPDQPLGEGGLRDEEGAGDLRRRQPAERAERECDPRVEREGRVAAGKDEAQPVVGNRAHLVLTFCRPFCGRDGRQLRLELDLVAQ